MEFKGQQPIYLQIAELICSQILEGTYAEDDRLPSVREYATQVEVNVNTLVRSYDWLSQQGIIYNRRGLGYYVSPGAAGCISSQRRRYFFDHTLPEVFTVMQSLGIGTDEVMRAHEQFLHNRQTADGPT